ncbi:hypothetical protein DFH09DRAFT_1078357 [Mycena vulgaris]|nr:hypothetical protein DFH09DRAFT_1078357 [Mycena vulgaris]
MVKMVRRRMELVNKPQIGGPDNWAYATAQLNLTPAQQATEDPEQNTPLSKDLDFFGGAHIDRKDAPALYSNMTCNHDIPDDYEPGMFFILQLGVFIELKQYSSINFFGQRRHGGTPPLSPLGTPLYKFAYRFVVIYYPPNRMVNGTARVTLAALPNNEALIIPPEILHTGCSNRTEAGWSSNPSTTRSSFIQEGLGMMTPVSVLTFVVRYLLLLMFYILQQLPRDLNVQFDPDLIIQAITYEAEGGKRMNVGPWDMAPGHRRQSSVPWNYESADGLRVSQDEIRSAAWVEWQKYEDHVVSHIPYLGRNGPVRTTFSKPKKTQKMMHPESEADDEASESDTDSDADSDDEQLIAWRKGMVAAAKAKEELKKKANAEMKTAKAAMKAAQIAVQEASGSKKKKRNAPKEPEAEQLTDPGVSEPEEPLAARPVQAGRADRAKVRAERRGSVHVESSKALGKRKERPVLIEGEHGRAKQSSNLGWNSAAAVDTGDVEMKDIERVRTRRSASSFVESVTAATLDANWADIESVCRSIAHAPPDQDVAAMQALQIFFAAVGEDPDAVETTSVISGIWPKLSVLTGHESVMALTTRLHRHSIMVTNYYAWRWLDSYCTSQIELIFGERPATAANWLASLTRDVKNLIENRTQSKDFDAQKYGLSISGASQVFQYRSPAPRFILADEVLPELARVPNDTLARYQAWFTHLVILRWGEHALLLDEVWKSYTHLRRYVLGDAKDKVVVIERLRVLSGELANHPLADSTSLEAETLANIAGLIQQVKSGDLSYCTIEYPEPSAELDDDPPLAEESDVVIPDAAIQDDQDSPSHSGESGPEDDSSASEGAAPVQSAQNYLDLGAEQMEQEFYRFLQEASDLRGPPLHALNDFQGKLNGSMDYLFPGREFAPSRQRVLATDGPYTAERIRTNAGFLSAVIFRGCTFGTEFLAQYPTFFADIGEFHSVKALATADYRTKYGKDPPEKFFCLRGAYGPSNHRRLISLADTYATAIEADSWAAKFEGQDKVPFVECFNWLSGDIPRTGCKRFPVLGPLGSYLLTADLVYASAVMTPTLDEMGYIIRELNKGAVAGLEMLRLIPPRKRLERGCQKANVNDCRRAFRAIYNKVMKGVPQKARDRLGFDFIVLEHALCKLSRCASKGYYKNRNGVRFTTTHAKTTRARVPRARAPRTRK